MRSPISMPPDAFFYPPLGVVAHQDFYQFGCSERTQPFRKQAPCVDVLEDASQFLIVMEVPGMTKEEINIELHGHSLTISGDMPLSTLYPTSAAPTLVPTASTSSGDTPASPTLPTGPAEHYRIRERTYGHFKRDISVPAGTADEHMSALIQHGLLKITILKGEGKSGVVNKLIRVLSR